jgi:hypothetical protein
MAARAYRVDERLHVATLANSALAAAQTDDGARAFELALAALHALPPPDVEATGARLERTRRQPADDREGDQDDDGFDLNHEALAVLHGALVRANAGVFAAVYGGVPEVRGLSR